MFAYRALAFDPTNEEAHLLCGHEKRGRDWVVRCGKKKRLFSSIVESRDGPTSWDEAWEFETTHYRLVTNLDLAWASALALELELFYHAFYAWFGADMELFEVVEPMACQVHADKASFPESSGRIAYFDGARNVLYELALAGLELDVLAHEATHQILHNTAVATRKGSGLIPSWLNEGLAEYMSSCRKGVPGRGSYDSSAIHSLHFATHRQARKPYDLGRILSMSSADFAASSKADLKYAQAYTLVHFCLHGEEGSRRPDFMEFLRSAYRGQGSSTAFKSAMKQREHDLELAWQRHVEAVTATRK